MVGLVEKNKVVALVVVVEAGTFSHGSAPPLKKPQTVGVR